MDNTPPPSTPNLKPSPEPVKIDPEKIHLMVRNRHHILFDEQVKAVTSNNDTGVFDVLPEHANFISVIKEKITIHKLDGQEQVIPLANGIMKVKDSSVRCFIDLLTAEAQKVN